MTFCHGNASIVTVSAHVNRQTETFKTDTSWQPRSQGIFAFFANKLTPLLSNTFSLRICFGIVSLDLKRLGRYYAVLIIDIASDDFDSIYAC